MKVELNLISSTFDDDYLLQVIVIELRVDLRILLTYCPCAVHRIRVIILSNDVSA